MKPIPLASPIKIWYKSLPKLPRVLWPMIDIKLSYGGVELPQSVFALVDSGANTSIIHPELAEVLGFTSKQLGLSQGGGISVSGYYKSWTLPKLITVEIYGFSFSFKFMVIDNKNLIWPCILGEDSIFQVARLDFQKFKGYFKIRFRQDLN